MRKRKDGNQHLLENEFIARGATICDLSQAPGVLDLLVGFRGETAWVEIKDGRLSPSRRALTAMEQRRFDEWNGDGPHLVESVEHVERLLTYMARRAQVRRHAELAATTERMI